LLKSSVFLRHERPKKKDSFRNVSFTMNIVLQENKGKIIAKKKCRRYLAEPYMSMGGVVERGR